MTALRSRAGALAVAALALVLVGACSDEPSVEEFCAAAEATVATGPLFPDRTDGEPVPEPDALAALEDLADRAPDEVDDPLEVLVAEARALVAEAEARAGAATGSTDTSTTADAPARPSRAEVEAAQAAVVAYVTDNCALDLDPT